MPEALLSRTDLAALGLPRRAVDATFRALDVRPAGVLEAVSPAAYRLPVLYLDATWMRVGELEKLRWRDVDEREGRWRVSRARAENVAEPVGSGAGDAATRRSGGGSA
jgi:integrase